MRRGTFSRREAAIAALVVAGLPLAVLWPFFTHRGVPGFSHDWVWSLFAEQTRSQWQLLLSAWQHISVGSPNAVPTVNPAAWLKVALAWVVPGADSEKIFLFLSVALASGATYVAARDRLRVSTFAAACAAVAFIGGAFCFSKIASGQSSYWIAIGAFAWGAYFLLGAYERDDLRAALWGGLCFAVSTIQLQFLPFAWIAIILGALTRGRVAAWRVAFVMLGASLCFALPSIALLGGLGPARGADVPQPYPLWQYAQSSSPMDALTWMGYTGFYPEHAAASLFAAGPIFVRYATLLVVIAGTVFALRSLRTLAVRWLLALAVVGFVWVTGYDGPLSFLWQWLFTHVGDAAFLREFYHAAIFSSFSAVLLFALALDAAFRRWRIPAAATAVIVIAFATLPSWTGGYGRILPFLTPPPYLAQARALLPATRSRLLSYPIAQPLSIDGSIGGNDVFDWTGPEHTSLYRFFLQQPVAYAAAQFNSGDAAAAAAMMPRVSAAAILVRPGVSSIAPGASPTSAADIARGMHAHDIVALTGAQLIPTAPLPVISGAVRVAPMPPDFHDLTSPSTSYIDIEGESAAALQRPLVFRPDPALGWVTTQQSLLTSADAAASPALGLETTRVGASITVPSSPQARSLSVWAPDGARINGRTVIAPRFRDLQLPAGLSTTIVAMGPTALGELGRESISERVGSSEATGNFTAPWLASGTVRVDGRGLLVLRETFDPGWHVHIRGAAVERHVRVDGYANGWIVDGNGTYAFTMEYTPQRLVWWLLSLSLALSIALFAIGVAVWIRS